MSNTTECAFEYFELFLVGLKDEYDALFAEIQMAARASVLDYKDIGKHVGFLTVLQIVGENGNALLTSNFEKLNEEEIDLLQRKPECFLDGMIRIAEEACGTDHVKKQITEILKRDFPMLNPERTLAYLEEGADKAAVWLRKVIEVEPAEELFAETSEEPLMIVR